MNPFKPKINMESAGAVFDPKEDITAYELALILKQDKPAANLGFVRMLPERVQRHFRIF